MSDQAKLDAAKVRAKESDLVWQPVGPLSESELDNLLQEQPQTLVYDALDRQVEELFKVNNPKLRPFMAEYHEQFTDFQEQFYAGRPGELCGTWWYYPWRQSIAHLLNREHHTRLRTARNRNMIRDHEQQQLADASVGIAGMSVGSNVLTALSLLGPFRELRVADGDRLDVTNMNRIRSAVTEIGLPKVIRAAREVKELDPWAQIELFNEGMSEENLEQFLEGLSVVVDEMDDLRLKALLRVAAKKRGLPVVMATDAGNNCIMDIERFDLDTEMPIFHGRLQPNELDSLINEKADPARWAELSMKIIGAEHAEPRIFEVLKEFQEGKLAGIPQMGPSAMMSGAVTAFAVRQIIHGEAVKTGKVGINVVQHIIEESAAVPADESEVT